MYPAHGSQMKADSVRSGKIHAYRVFQKLLPTGCFKNFCLQGVSKIMPYSVFQKFLPTGCFKNCCLQDVSKIVACRVFQKFLFTGCFKNCALQSVSKLPHRSRTRVAGALSRPARRRWSTFTPLFTRQFKERMEIHTKSAP